MARSHPEAISPTAHYTGYVWFAHGHSHEAFATRTGRVMYQALRAPNAIALRTGLPTLEGMLLARHRLIDLRLEQAIEAGEVEQVVEVACGLSPRGWRFAERYGDGVTYVEADLPGVQRESLELTLEKNILRISAERQAPEGERTYWHNERAFGRVERSITLPETVDPDSIEASLKDGVLLVKLRKRPESLAKRIEIKS